MAYEYRYQLCDLRTGKALTHDGKFQVVQANTPTRVAIYDLNDAALANPATIADGMLIFRTLETVEKVDIYFQTDKGYCGVVRGATRGDFGDILIDLNNLRQTLIIPFDIADTELVDATELNTGFVLATDSVVLPDGNGVLVTGTDATETIDAGILSSESGGDADGFIKGLSLATAAFVPAGVTVTTGVIQANPLRGALLADHADGTNADDRGIHQTKPYRCNGTAKTVSLTVSTGTDTGKGFLFLNTLLTNNPQPA